MIALTVLLAMSASASSVTVENQYVAGGSPVSAPGACSSGATDLPHVGSACFVVPSSTDRIWVDVEDRVTDTPGGTITFFSGSGSMLSPQVHFCTDKIRHDVPSDAARMVIDFWGPLDTEHPSCIATSGTVYVDFS